MRGKSENIKHSQKALDVSDLNFAIAQNLIDKVKEAIKAGVLMTNSTTSRAIESGNIDIVNAVIAAKAPMTMLDLDLAISSGKDAIVSALLRAGVPMLPDATDRAIYTKNDRIVNAVIKADAPVNAEHLDLAKRSRNESIINIVKNKLNHIDDTKKNSQGNRNRLFSTSPTEQLATIAPSMENNPDVIEDDREAYEVPFQ